MKQDKRKEFYYFIFLINNDFARHFEKSPKRDMTSYWQEDWTTDFLGDAPYLLAWKYVFLLHLLNKNENIVNAWVLGTFWKSQKWIPSKKSQSVLMAKISSRKTQKTTNP